MTTGPAEEKTTGVRLLVAEDDEAMRTLLVIVFRELEGVAAVVETADGAGAVASGRAGRLELAVLDLVMPGVDGVGAARGLLRLQPWLRIALQSADARLLRERSAGLALPLFDKRDLDGLVAWVEREAEAAAAEMRSRAHVISV